MINVVATKSQSGKIKEMNKSLLFDANFDSNSPPFLDDGTGSDVTIFSSAGNAGYVRKMPKKIRTNFSKHSAKESEAEQPGYVL